MLKNMAFLALLALSIISCAHKTNTSPARPLRLTLFDCGEIIAKDVSVFSPGVDKGKTKILTDTCYLIEHPKGKMIWDTGLGDDLAAKSKGEDMMDGKFHISMKRGFLPQLADIGVRPEMIDYLGISHFHRDHTGEAFAFNKATVLVQKEEYASAFTPAAKKGGVDPKFAQFLKTTKVKQLEGDYDVFGDGSVIIMRMVGHTPGHQVLFVNLKETGPVLLTGDLYHFTKNRENRRVPSFNTDKQATLDSMKVFEDFAAEKKAKVWIQHDWEQNQKLAHAPKYFE